MIPTVLGVTAAVSGFAVTALVLSFLRARAQQEAAEWRVKAERLEAWSEQAAAKIAAQEKTIESYSKMVSISAGDHRNALAWLIRARMPEPESADDSDDDTEVRPDSPAADTPESSR